MIKHIILPKEKDLGEFSVKRLLPAREQQMIGPWIFFDHMGPANFKAGNGVNVRPHPHINLATVTYLFEGEILHRDSLDNEQVILPGYVNLMVAGRGIVHSEREREEVKNSEHRTHGLQLWLALPKEQEEIEPAFYHYPKDAIPSKNLEGANIKIIMGDAYEVCSPVKTFSDTIYIEASIDKNFSIDSPIAEELGIYVVEGAIDVQGQQVSNGQMLYLRSESSEKITALSGKTKIAIIGGAKMGHRHIFWNFISTRKERIEDAKLQWKNKKFPAIPSDPDEFIPLPE